MRSSELPPPENRGALLAALGRCPRAVYWLVRRTLDDLDSVAPWSDLYSPPAADDLRRIVTGLLQVASAVPERIDREMAGLRSSVTGEEETQEVDEAEFFLATTDQMIAADRRNLRRTLDKLGGRSELRREDCENLIELGADLKGKIGSALMGAATALITAGRWHAADVEGILFPEKAEEAERNERLLATLTKVAGQLEAGLARLDVKGLLQSWRLRQPVDRYALVDLVSLRADLCDLLRLTHRRALYSGDFHQLRLREDELGRRIRELEDLHLFSLDRPDVTAKSKSDGPFGRLQQLLLETVALLDVEELRRQIGGSVVDDLRASPAGRAARPGGDDTASRLESLRHLLANDDLKTFLAVLLGAVRRRASLAREAIDQARPTGEEIDWAATEPIADAPHAEVLSAVQPTGELAEVVSRLLVDDNPAWRSFRMVRKLLGKHTLLPRQLLAESHSFVLQLMNELLPALEARSKGGGASPEAARLIELHRRICVHQPTPSEVRQELAGDLDEVVGLLGDIAKA